MTPPPPTAPLASTLDAARSCYADAQTARRAVDLAEPMIEAVLGQHEMCGSGVIAIVVMDPGLQPGDAGFEDAVLHTASFGKPRSQWDADYLEFARAKARTSWRLDASGAKVHAGLAHLLRRGDSLLHGAVVLDGIVVAVSGAESWYDEAIGTAVAANLRAMAWERHARAVRERQSLAC
ncbi:MAG TPA: hypothetical protein VFR90_08405 [Methylibium sp.]|uniref:hypothetical protein n=1 Tax=Methylibium sp. TaxID=2067992 RepID=UPI002DBBCB57|nr:hypothetical protein [Methylibium sp.]HEU4459127.1 hypothetical protein [Methylibium sp.]